MLIAGLTGGIATGKSTVSGMLQIAGAVIIDADAVAREVVQKGRPAYGKIRAHFGDGVFTPDGDIDRIKLGDVIFKDPAQKKILDGIVHPDVFSEVAAKLKAIENETPDAVVILDVPLLIESGMHTGMADVIVVYVPEPLQLRRLMDRDNSTEPDALARIRSQMPIEEKKQFATILIDNSGDLAQTREQTMAAYAKLKKK